MVYASRVSADLWAVGSSTLPHLGIHDCKPSLTGIPGKSLAKHHRPIVKLRSGLRRPIRRMPRGCQHTHPPFTPLISNPLLSFVPPLTLTLLPEIPCTACCESNAWRRHEVSIRPTTMPTPSNSFDKIQKAHVPPVHPA